MKYCEEFAALLDPYVDGELPLEEAARVRAHLAVCGGCRAYVQAALAHPGRVPGRGGNRGAGGLCRGRDGRRPGQCRAQAAQPPQVAEDPAAAGGVLCRGGAGYLGLPRLQDNTAESIRAEDAAVTAAERLPLKRAFRPSLPTAERISPPPRRRRPPVRRSPARRDRPPLRPRTASARRRRARMPAARRGRCRRPRRRLRRRCWTRMPARPASPPSP